MISLPVRADREESDEDLRLYLEESDEESWYEPAGEAEEGGKSFCGLL